MTRILFVSPTHLPLVVGGGQIGTHQLGLELQRRGHTIAVLAGRPARLSFQQPVSSDRALGYLSVNAWYAERWLGEVVDSFRPEVVVVHAHHAETAGWVKAMLRGTGRLPTALYLHDVGCAGLAAEYGLSVDAVAGVSRFLVSQARRAGAIVECIPPLIDRLQYRIRTSRRKVLFVNPVPAKGLDVALYLAEARPDIPFAFARCWHIERDALDTLYDRTRRLGNVELRPPVRDPTGLYCDARILLAPSRYPEGWARVVTEAQMSGIPAIATRLGGLPEAVGEGGLLVEPEDGADAWLEALSAMWDDDSAYAGFVARAERAGDREALSPTSVVDRFEALLADARVRSAGRPARPYEQGRAAASATHSFGTPG